MSCAGQEIQKPDSRSLVLISIAYAPACGLAVGTGGAVNAVGADTSPGRRGPLPGAAYVRVSLVGAGPGLNVGFAAFSCAWAQVAMRTGSGIRYHQYTMTSREPFDPKVIDEMYGLEPVIEPRVGEAAGLAQFVTVQCPYCGEAFETPVDLSAGSFQYVEDCQVCCQPIEFVGEVDGRGRLVGFTASRSG